MHRVRTPFLAHYLITRLMKYLYESAIYRASSLWLWRGSRTGATRAENTMRGVSEAKCGDKPSKNASETKMNQNKFNE